MKSDCFPHHPEDAVCFHSINRKPVSPMLLIEDAASTLSTIIHLALFSITVQATKVFTAGLKR